MIKKKKNENQVFSFTNKNVVKNIAKNNEETDTSEMIQCFLIVGEQFNFIDDITHFPDYFNMDQFKDGMGFKMKTIMMKKNDLVKYKKKHNYI